VNNMNIKCVLVGSLDTNCYIVENNDSCLIIDPGDEFDKIKKNISKKVVGVLITHKHYDHIGALNECINYYKVKSYDRYNLVEGENIIENFNFVVKYNFGHTIDSISFIFDDIMFSGDFIFNNSIGRWDLGGDFFLMQESIRDILESKINYKIYPGHGNVTCLDAERKQLSNYI